MKVTWSLRKYYPVNTRFFSIFIDEMKKNNDFFNFKGKI